MPLNSQFDPARSESDFSKYEHPYEVARTRILERLIPPGQGENALDIGCGPGYFSRKLTAKGWKTTAIDTDTRKVESAKNYALETHLGDAAGVLPTLPQNHYGLVLALEIIEHIPKNQGPGMLRAILTVLKPGGRLIISTPNRFSLEGLAYYYWTEKLKKRGKWTAWDETHVYIYSSPEFLRLLKRSGFVLEQIIGYYYGSSHPRLARWKPPFEESALFPLNRLGFNLIVQCRKR